MKNLIYLVAFKNPINIRLLEFFFSSVVLFNKEYLENLDFLVITEEAFQSEITEIGIRLGHPIQTWILPSVTKIFFAALMRYTIFSWPFLQNYSKVLYCDTDILITNKLDRVFNILQDSDKLYTLREGILGQDYWGGKDIFEFDGKDKELDPNQEGVCTGVFLFEPTPHMSRVFSKILEHICDRINRPNVTYPICYDQPYVNYVLAKNNFHDNMALSQVVINRPHMLIPQFIIYHFTGVSYTIKLKMMLDYLETMIQQLPCDTSKVPIVEKSILRGKWFLMSYNENEDVNKKY